MKRDQSQNRGDSALKVLWSVVWVRALAHVALSGFAVVVLWQLRGSYAFALQIGLIGFIIAYLLNPLVVVLTRIRVRRALAVTIVYLLLLLLFVFGSFLITRVVAETGRFVNLLPAAFDSIDLEFSNVSTWMAGVVDRLPAFVSDRLGVQATDEDLNNQVRDQSLAILERTSEGINKVLEKLVTDGPNALIAGATNILSTTVQVFLIFVVSAYFLYDFPRFTASFRRIIPVYWRPLYGDLAKKADKAVGGYLRGQLLITTLLGFMIWVGLSLVGVPLALAISFLAAIFNLVPFLGPIVGVIPAVLFGFTVSPLTPVFVLLIFLAANQIEGYLLTPLILSRSVKLHPLTVLLAIIVGIGLLGLLGAILAVPTVAFAKLVIDEYILNSPLYDESLEASSEVDSGEIVRANSKGDANA
jgi:predicted PurR-regulated permease PerM